MSITILDKKYDIKLQTLYLYNNQLESIPAEIGKLINLQILYVHNNQLERIPVEICRLINLQRLDLQNNQLESIPRALALRGCYAVRRKLVNLLI